MFNVNHSTSLTIFVLVNCLQPYQSDALIEIMSRGRPNPMMTTSTAMTAVKIPAHVVEFISVCVCVLMYVYTLTVMYAWILGKNYTRGRVPK